MNRAERRRQNKEASKKKATYNFTMEELRAQINREVRAEYDRQFKALDEEREKIKQEATGDAVNQAMILLFTLPLEVLMDHYWRKTYPRKLPEFTDHLLDYYTRWQNGELDMEALQKDLWEYGGIRFKEGESND